MARRTRSNPGEGISNETANRYLTAAEYAAHYRISERTVRRLIARGAIRIVRVGRNVRIPLSQILE